MKTLQMNKKNYIFITDLMQNVYFLLQLQKSHSKD